MLGESQNDWMYSLKCSKLIPIKPYLAKFCAALSLWNTPKGITLLCQVALWSTVCMKVELQYTLSPWQAPQVKRTLLSLKLILTLNGFTYTPIYLMKNVLRESSALWSLRSWPTRFAFLTQHTIIDREWNADSTIMTIRKMKWNRSLAWNQYLQYFIYLTVYEDIIKNDK